MEGEKTSSITQLVKIVAGEVFDEKMKAYESNRRRDTGCREKVAESLKQKGCPWSIDEDRLLVDEIQTALQQIAQNHGRTEGAIRSRIKQRYTWCFSDTE